jgi:hypothetical protein
LFEAGGADLNRSKKAFGSSLLFTVAKHIVH